MACRLKYIKIVSGLKGGVESLQAEFNGKGPMGQARICAKYLRAQILDTKSGLPISRDEAELHRLKSFLKEIASSLAGKEIASANETLSAVCEDIDQIKFAVLRIQQEKRSVITGNTKLADYDSAAAPQETYTYVIPGGGNVQLAMHEVLTAFAHYEPGGAIQ